ncbi:MAG: sigma 54-interacting transcriptional regulator [Pseudomonadota bacterium]
MHQTKRILVVDDDRRNIQLLQGMLDSLGYESETAVDGFDALEKLKPGIDLVLLDVMMPGMDGFDVARRMRANPEMGHVPIIMVTVLTSKEDRLEAVRAGANDFISKPIDRLELQVRTASLLGMKEAQDALKDHLRQLEAAVQQRTKALVESEKRFRSLFETAQDCIFLKDSELRYTEVNRAFLELLGARESAIIGRKDRDLFDESYAEQAQKLEGRVLEGQTVDSPQTINYVDRSIRLDFVRFPLRNETGVIIGVCAIAREIPSPPAVPCETSGKDEEFPSAAMRSTLDRARMAAESESIVILTGESGAGKDYLAQYIHKHSKRSGGPFHAINCAAVPPELAESELFGHEPGAFTGASRRRKGLVELAEGGTLLLNEIGELPLALQAKLLTFLDTFKFTRVGGETSISIDARLIAATNRDLVREVEAGRFRKDLFYRIHVFSIWVPPLRERIDDIPLLVGKLLRGLAPDLPSRTLPEISKAVMDGLCRYSWPGNVRELRNVIERALIVSRGGPLLPQHLGLTDPESACADASMNLPLERSLPKLLGELERKLIADALEQSKGVKQEAARLLGISRFALTRHLAKLDSAER